MADEEEHEVLLEAGVAVDELITVGGGGGALGEGSRADDDAQPRRRTLTFKVLAALGGVATVVGLVGLVFHIWALVSWRRPP